MLTTLVRPSLTWSVRAGPAQIRILDVWESASKLLGLAADLHPAVPHHVHPIGVAEDLGDVLLDGPGEDARSIPAFCNAFLELAGIKRRVAEVRPRGEWLRRNGRLWPAAAFGIVWEPVREHQLSNITLAGNVSPSRTLVTHGKTSEGFEIEMIQVLEGAVADDVVLGGQEGVSHFAFTVDDLPPRPRRGSAGCGSFLNTGPST
jgi:hypothetical protein